MVSCVYMQRTFDHFLYDLSNSPFSLLDAKYLWTHIRLFEFFKKEIWWPEYSIDIQVHQVDPSLKEENGILNHYHVRNQCMFGGHRGPVSRWDAVVDRCHHLFVSGGTHKWIPGKIKRKRERAETLQVRWRSVTGESWVPVVSMSRDGTSFFFFFFFFFKC